MWFTKLLGSRSKDLEDEPARFAAPVPTQTGKPVSDRSGSSKAGTAQQVKSGFDPYNSGSFDAGNAWERTIRR